MLRERLICLLVFTGLTGAQLLLISGGNVSYMIERKEKKDNRKNGQRKEDRELVRVCVRVCVIDETE